MILYWREIDFGGRGNALRLRFTAPNETITVDWVQLLPDNYEGDFYVLVLKTESNVPYFPL